MGPLTGKYRCGDCKEGCMLSVCPTPRQSTERPKEKPIHDTSRSNGVWSSSAVIHILTDERYAGTYVIGKRAVKEIGGTRSRLKDESEWIKIPDHHPAIVSMELYEQANAVRRQFKQPNKQRRDYLLRGRFLRILRSCHVPQRENNLVLLQTRRSF